MRRKMNYKMQILTEKEVQIEQDIWDTIKKGPNQQILGIEGREQVQAKDLENIFNVIIDENISNLEKAIVIWIIGSF